MPLIPERVWAQMTDDEQRIVNDYVDGFRHEPRIVCPHCGGGVAVKIKVTAGATRIDAETGERERGASPKELPGTNTVIGARDRAFLVAARESGLLGAFFAAVKTEKEFGGAPGDIESFFLLFWQTAAPTKVPSVVLAAWIEDFGGRIEVWQAQGIIAILSNGQLMAFFPNRLTVPQKNTAGTVTVSNAGGFGAWRKSRFGYVPVEARSFGEALQQRNMGAFGAMVQ